MSESSQLAGWINCVSVSPMIVLALFAKCVAFILPSTGSLQRS